MLGAVVGGLLENCSLIIGLRALLLLAFALYVFAGIGLIMKQKAGKGTAKLAPMLGH